MKRSLATLLISILTYTACVLPVEAESLSVANSTLSPAAINAESALLIDADTGQVLFEKNANAKMFPASTTKALTALIIAEDLKLDEQVIIDKDTPFTSGSRIYVIEGETFTVEQLLYAMLLESANDAAVALAKHHSGTVEQFAKKMNDRAKELGCSTSNFVNPNGLPNDAHVTSAKDLALIGQAFVKHPELMKIVQTYKYDLPATNKQPEIRHLFNSNRFLYGTGAKNKIQVNGQTIDIKWEPVTGLKTGYTNAAQQCFIVSASQNGRNLIAVILKATGNNLYIDPRLMLEYGFTQLKPFQFGVKGQLMDSITLEGEKKAKVDLYTASDVKALIPLQADEKAITSEVVINPDIKLPITENQVLGKLIIRYNNQQLTTTDLVSLSTIGADATLGKETNRYVKWIPIDQSPEALTNLGIRVGAALVLWQLILRLLKGKSQKKQPPRRPSRNAQRPAPHRVPPQMPLNPPPRHQAGQQRPNAQTVKRDTRPRPPMQTEQNQMPRPRPDYLKDATYRPSKRKSSS